MRTEVLNDAASRRTMTREEWAAEARKRFGDASGWRFICPSCGHEATPADWRKAGAPDSAIAFSCIGRYLDADGGKTFKREGGPCNYAGGGLFKLNPITVIDEDGCEHSVFDFAPEPHP